MALARVLDPGLRRDDGEWRALTQGACSSFPRRRESRASLQAAKADALDPRLRGDDEAWIACRSTTNVVRGRWCLAGPICGAAGPRGRGRCERPAGAELV